MQKKPKGLNSDLSKELQGILIKKTVLAESERLTKRYLGLLEEANDEDSPSYRGLIDEVEDVYGKYLEADGSDKEQFEHILKNYFGFDPQSKQDVDWMKKEQNKSLNDILGTIGASSYEEGDSDEILRDRGDETTYTSTATIDEPLLSTNVEEQPQFYDNPIPHLSNIVAGYQGEAPNLNPDMSMDAAYGSNVPSGNQPMTPSEYLEANPDTGIRPMLINEYPVVSDEGDTSETVIGSLDQFEETVTEEERVFNEYLESGQQFIYADENISIDNPLNIMSDSLSVMPTGTITLSSDSDAEFSGKMNWVTGEVYNESDGRYIGNLQHDNEALTNIRYNDSSTVLADKFSVVRDAGVQDKDYIRMTINHPDFNLREKLDSGEIKTPVEFINLLKEFVAKNDNGYKLGISTYNATNKTGDKAIDLLSLFYDESKNPVGTKMTYEQYEIINTIWEVMQEYHKLKNPPTYQSDIDSTLEEFSSRDEALSGLVDGSLTQEQFDRAYPVVD